MKRIMAGVAGAVAVLVAGAAPAIAAPARGRAEPAQMVSAIVILSQQADSSADPLRPRAQRRASAEQALRATAAASQRDLIDLLGRRRAQGLVSRITPLWIINGVSISATPGLLQELARRRDVRAIQPD